MPLLSSVILLFALPQADVDSQVKTFTEALAKVQEQSADPASVDTLLYKGAIPGMLRQLDPHSVFFDRDQFEQLRQMEQSVQKGFGTILSLIPGRVIVLQVLPGTPSARSGISPGDEIIAVNRYPLAGFEIEQLVELLNAARQGTVLLEVRRAGNARTLSFTLTPEAMDTPSVDRAFLLNPKVGYVRIASFEDKTAAETKTAIEHLGGSALQGLVLDLRSNPGGLVPAALEIASYFLQPGQRIISVKGRNGKNQEVDVPKLAKPYAFPMAVLINEKTASAAEIVTGALQDHDRATVLGTASYGKGLVQSVLPLSGGTGLALTTAFYYTPSGRSIQKPLRAGQLNDVTTTPQPEYKTNAGRRVQGGGGIQPDRIIRAERITRLREALEATGAFPQFATEHVKGQPVISTGELPSSVVDSFKVWLSERGIQPGIAEWSVDRDWTVSRLHQEIVNQALGVAAGDEIEMRRDPAVKAALESIDQGR